MTDKTYHVVCFTFDDSNVHSHEVIVRGLTLDQAQAICNDPATSGNDKEHGGPWFYGYEEDR